MKLFVFFVFFAGLPVAFLEVEKCNRKIMGHSDLSVGAPSEAGARRRS
jgi:hypothetical protein